MENGISNQNKHDARQTRYNSFHFQYLHFELMIPLKTQQMQSLMQEV